MPTSNYGDLTGADLVIVTVGASKMQSSRLELLGQNAVVVREVVDALDDEAPKRW